MVRPPMPVDHISGLNSMALGGLRLNSTGLTSTELGGARSGDTTLATFSFPCTIPHIANGESWFHKLRSLTAGGSAERLSDCGTSSSNPGGWLGHGSGRGPGGVAPGSIPHGPHMAILWYIPAPIDCSIRHWWSHAAEPSHLGICAAGPGALVPRTEGCSIGGGGVLRLERREHVVGARCRARRQRPVPETDTGHAFGIDNGSGTSTEKSEKSFIARRQVVYGSRAYEHARTGIQEVVRPREPGPRSGRGSSHYRVAASLGRRHSRHLRHPGGRFAFWHLSPGRHRGCCPSAGIQRRHPQALSLTLTGIAAWESVINATTTSIPKATACIKCMLYNS